MFSSSRIDSIFRTADAVGDAWSWLVMREALLYDVRRFDAFQDRLGIARSTLSARLTQLVDAGLLVRQPGGEYRPTDSGQDFFSCLMVSMRWADQWYFPAGAPPQPVAHVGCGQPLRGVLRCEACHDVVAPGDVTAHRAGTAAHPPIESIRRRNRSPDLALLERKRTCSIARTLNVAGDWWSGLIIRECFFGTRRFEEFQRRLEIAPNILSGRLRRLVTLDILTKVQYEAWPVRHEYRLTERGLDFYHFPLAMLMWGRRWLEPTGTDANLIHKPCGSALEASLACASCGEAVSRADVALTPV
jgi:DNA-binding HxlR family transcriptional regulator